MHFVSTDTTIIYHFFRKAIRSYFTTDIKAITWSRESHVQQAQIFFIVFIFDCSRASPYMGEVFS